MIDKLVVECLTEYAELQPLDSPKRTIVLEAIKQAQLSIDGIVPRV